MESEFLENDGEIEILEPEKTENTDRIVENHIIGPTLNPKDVFLPPAKDNEIDKTAPLGSRLNPLGVIARPLTALERQVIRTKKFKVPKTVEVHIQNQEKEIAQLKNKYQDTLDYANHLQDAMNSLVEQLKNACLSRGKVESKTEDEALAFLEVGIKKLKSSETRFEGMEILVAYLGLQ